MAASVTALADRFQTFQSFRYHPYRLFWLSMAATMMGQAFWITAQGWLVLELTNSAFLLGLTSFAFNFPVLPLSLFAGAYADRLNRRLLLLLVQGSFAILVVLLATLALSGVVDIWQILIIALVSGVARAFLWPARQAMVPDLVPRQDVVNAVALNSAGFHIANSLGSAAAGWLVGVIAAAGSLYASGTVTILALLALLPVNVAHPKGGRAAASLWAEIGEGLRYAWRDRNVLAIIALLVLLAILGEFRVLLPVFARDILGMGAVGLGLLMASGSVGALLGTITLASLGHFRRRGWLLLGMLLTSGLSLLFFALSRSFLLSLLLVGITHAMASMFSSLSAALLQTLTPDDLRGRLMGIFSMSYMGMFPIGSLLIGSLASLLGAPPALSLAALGIILLTILMALSSPRFRRLQ